MKKVGEQFHFWKDDSSYYTDVDQENCDSYDNVPVKTIKDACIEFLANGQIAENNMRKIYFGEQYDTSDNMEYIDLANQLAEEKIARFRHQNQQATAGHNEELKQEREEEKSESSENNAKGE